VFPAVTVMFIRRLKSDSQFIVEKGLGIQLCRPASLVVADMMKLGDRSLVYEFLDGRVNHTRTFRKGRWLSCTSLQLFAHCSD
jgi:hypothetical protein